MSTNQLSRSLHLRDLVVMGIILVQPTAPMPLFGVVQTEARGHVVTAVLVAMVAMLFTAISYARMAAAYPVAGSAYTYVGRQLHPALGFLTGWSMLLDYVVNPVICTIWSAKAAGNILPSVPYAVWAVFFAGLFTFLNLRRIQTTAKTNAMLAGAMLIVVAAVFIAVGRTLGPGTDYGKPFYDASTFDWSKMGSGTALAVLTYIGFDGVSTLAEETENPRRNVGRAMVIICMIIGTLSALEVYAGQLAWPASEAFPDVDTAYVHVAGRVGGPILFQIVNLTLLIATIGSGSGGQLAGARLLYGMGRDEALPKSFFGQLHPKTFIPANNVMLIGVLCLIGAFLMSYQIGAELLNFGAFIGFMGVNLAALLLGWRNPETRSLGRAVLPALGFVVCLVIWLNLSNIAKIAGFSWLVLGLAYGWWKTQGFQKMMRFEG
jgi:amino acid transporter